MTSGSSSETQLLLRRLISDRNNAVTKKLKEQFPNREEAWAIGYLLQLRVLPVLDGLKCEGRKTSKELAKARFCVVLNTSFKRPQQLRSGIVKLDGLTDKEGTAFMQSLVQHDKFLDSNPSKAARAYAHEMEKAEKSGRHSILCNDLEWEILTRWRKEVSAAHKKRELKAFVDKLRNKASLRNLTTTIHRLGLSKKITK
jgi:hypothetical protein